MDRIVVSVDPSAGDGEAEQSNAAGIVVAGMGADKHRYVLADRTTRGKPRAWASAAIKAYYEFNADLIVAESNNGGLMVQETIEAIDDKPKVTLINASRGKRPRAEPISAEYEKGLWHHVGTFLALEAEQCTWKPGMPSPDRMDALVWAGHELGGTVGKFGVRII
jgi:phage terminase large subunit-like protein